MAKNQMRSPEKRDKNFKQFQNSVIRKAYRIQNRAHINTGSTNHEKKRPVSHIDVVSELKQNSIRLNNGEEMLWK